MNEYVTSAIGLGQKYAEFKSTESVLAYLVHQAARHKLTEADVWMSGKPAHWEPCDDCGEFLAFDEHDLCHRDPTPDTQEQVTTPDEVFAR